MAVTRKEEKAHAEAELLCTDELEKRIEKLKKAIAELEQSVFVLLAVILLVSIREVPAYAAGEGSSDHAAVDEETEETSEALYASVLDRYAAGAAENWDPQKFIDNGLCYIFGYDPGSAGYYFADVNGDGAEEMLLGMAGEQPEDPKHGYFYELYTLKDGEPVKVTEGTERYRFALCEDGTISASWSGGAGYSGYDFSVLPQGADQLEDRMRVIYDSMNPDHRLNVFKNEASPFDEKNNIAITEEEAEQIINGYQYLNPEFQPVTEYKTVTEEEDD